jgi:hypothetical protein
VIEPIESYTNGQWALLCPLQIESHDNHDDRRISWWNVNPVFVGSTPVQSDWQWMAVALNTPFAISISTIRTSVIVQLSCYLQSQFQCWIWLGVSDRARYSGLTVNFNGWICGLIWCLVFLTGRVCLMLCWPRYGGEMPTVRVPSIGSNPILRC